MSNVLVHLALAGPFLGIPAVQIGRQPGVLHDRASQELRSGTKLNSEAMQVLTNTPPWPQGCALTPASLTSLPAPLLLLLHCRLQDRSPPQNAKNFSSNRTPCHAPASHKDNRLPRCSLGYSSQSYRSSSQLQDLPKTSLQRQQQRTRKNETENLQS